MTETLLLKYIAGAVSILVVLAGYIATRVQKHEQSLYGTSGANGLTGDAKTARERLHRLSNRIHNAIARIALVESKLDIAPPELSPEDY